jgi:sodium-coupled neutral amino acid transporter 2
MYGNGAAFPIPSLPGTGAPLLDNHVSEMEDSEWNRGRTLSQFRAVTVLMNLIIGIGLLSIPFCFNTGAVTNCLVLGFIGTCAYLSFVLLVDSSLAAETSMDYTKLMHQAFPGLEWVPVLLVFLTLFGQAVMHLQFWSDLLGFIFDACEKLGRKVPTLLSNRWIAIGVPSAVICLPLTFLRNIKGYSQVSMFTCVLIVAYVVHAVYYFGLGIEKYGFDPEHRVVAFDPSGYFIQSISIQAFAFHCHPGVGPTLAKLISPTRRRQYGTLAIVIVAGGLCYMIAGLFPYMTTIATGSKAGRNMRIVSPVVFHDYDTTQLFTMVVEGLYALFLLLTTPLVLFAARVALHDLISTDEPSDCMWNTVGIAVFIGVVLLAVLVKNIGTMFDFIGGVTISGIIYILPSAYYLKLCRKESTVKKIVAIALIPIGAATIVLCLYDAVNGILHPQPPKA